MKNHSRYWIINRQDEGKEDKEHTDDDDTKLITLDDNGRRHDCQLRECSNGQTDNMLVSEIKMQQKSLLTQQRTHLTDVTMKNALHKIGSKRREAKETYYKNFYKKGPQLHTAHKTITRSQ